CRLGVCGYTRQQLAGSQQQATCVQQLAPAQSRGGGVICCLAGSDNGGVGNSDTALCWRSCRDGTGGIDAQHGRLLYQIAESLPEAKPKTSRENWKTLEAATGKELEDAEAEPERSCQLPQRSWNQKKSPGIKLLSRGFSEGTVAI